MKKIFCSVVVLFAAVLYAQTYQLGDLVEKDGITAVVVYVDESGQHGLLMSPCAYVGDDCLDNKNQSQDFEKAKEEIRKAFEVRQNVIASIVKNRIKKECKKTGEDWQQMYDLAVQSARDTLEQQLLLLDMVASMPRMTYFKHNKDTRKEYETMCTDLLSLNTEYGKDNQRAICEYCLSKGVSLQDYFPQFYWATQLGKDWFIPGNHEFELFGYQFVDEMGGGMKNIKMEKMRKFADVKTKFTHNFRELTFPLLCSSHAIYPASCTGLTQNNAVYPIYPLYVASSTMVKGAWGESKENQKKCTKNVGSQYGGLAGLVEVIGEAASTGTFYQFFSGLGQGKDSGPMCVFISNTDDGAVCAMAEF